MSAAAAAFAAPAGDVDSYASNKGSAFVTAQIAAQHDDDTLLRDVLKDHNAASRKLTSTVSGPMLTGHASVSDLDSIRDIPFTELCHTGAKVTSKNWLNKIWRYTIAPVKEIYLPIMTRGLPTNFLMLTFRTYNRDFDLPHHNDDDLAQDLRDTLMPVRGRLHRNKSPLLAFKTALLNTPLLGIPGIVNFIDVRTQWFDAGVRHAIADGITQVVVIAAGYDTRAYRLAQPGVSFYEIDLPHASQMKQKLVRQHMPRDKYSWPEFVGADLSKVTLMQALSNTSWDQSRRTMFIIEGLVYYLPPAAVKQQLTAISETAVAGSRLFFDFLHLDSLSGETWHPGFETLMMAVWNKGETMHSGIDKRPEAIRTLLKKFGFRMFETLDAKQITSRFHPHVKSWRWWQPHVSPFFGYIAAEKVLSPMKRKDTLDYRNVPDTVPEDDRKTQ